MAVESLNLRGPCSGCGAQLASDQRYCVECGQRVGPPLVLPFAPPAPAAESKTGGGWMAALPVPLQTATTFAALALGFGVLVGTALSPNLTGIAAYPGPSFVAEEPPAETPSAPSGGGGSGGGPAPTAPAAAASTSTGESGGGGGQGSGGGKSKKKKQKQTPTQPQTFTGTVVRANAVAGSYTISTGGLIAVHADTLPQVGDQVEVPVRRLANGTYAEDGARQVTGKADSVTFTGTVTFCEDLEQPAAPCDGSSSTDHYAYSVSALGASVLVSAPFPAQGPPPKVGSRVDVSAKIGDPFKPIAPADEGTWTSDATCTPPYDESAGLPADPGKQPALVQTSVNVTGAPATNASLEAVVQTVCPGDAPKLVLSADDIREGRRDLAALAVPGGIDLAKLTPGQAVQVAVAIAEDGTMTLQGITSDQGAAGADDAAKGQGTLVGS